MAPPFRWSAIFAGAFIAVAIALVLWALGFAVAVSTLNPQSPAFGSGMRIGLAIWLLIVPLISLYFGGWSAARSSPLHFSKMSGGLHGLVVWALYQFINILFAGALLAGVVGGIAGLAGPQMQLGNQMLAGLIGAGAGALWGIFGALVLSAVTAVLGGIVGARRHEKREVRQPMPVQRPAESRA